MADRDAFGAARRPRGIHDVRERVGIHVGAGLALAGPDLVEPHRVGDAPELHGRRAAVGHHNAAGRVLGHEREPASGLRGIERQVGAAGFEHAEHRGHHRRRASGVESHHHVAPHAQRAESPRQRAGARIQLGIGQPCRIVEQRDGVGRAGGLRLEDAVHGGGIGIRVGRLRPVHEQAAPLVGAQHRQCGERTCGIRGDGGEQVRVVTGHPGDRLAAEEVGRVHEAAPEAVGPRVHLEIEVALRGARVHVEVAEVPSLGQACHRRLERHHRLEERVAPGVARGLQRGHHVLERQIVVGHRLQRHVADAAQQLHEARIAGAVHTQRERVGEEAEQPRDLGALAAGAHRADDEVVLARVAMDEHKVGGEQRHVERPALARAQRRQRGPESLRQREGVRRATVGQHGRPRPVAGQVNRRHVGEPFGPVLELARVGAALDLGALPRGPVGVLDRQVG